MVCICIVLQQGPSFFALLGRLPVQFVENGANSVTADISGLAPGSYFLSVGRLLNDADAFLDGKYVASGRLALGFPIQIGTSGESRSIKITWNTRYWSNRLYDFPVVLPYGVGVLVQAWREFTGIYMGPVFCFLLLILSLVHARISPAFSTRVYPHLILALTGLAYTFYLSGIPDLFWNSKTNTFVQILLRIALSSAFIHFLESYTKSTKSVQLAHFPLALLVAAISAKLPNW